MITSQLKVGFWDFAAEYACKIANAVPRKGESSSPSKIFANFPPDLKRFRVFRAPGFTAQLSQRKSAVFQKPKKIRFLGLDEESKMNIVWDIKSKKTLLVRDIVLDEKGLLSSTYKKFNKGFREDNVGKFYEFDFKSEKRKLKKQDKFYANEGNDDKISYK